MNNNPESIVSTIQAMRLREADAYVCQDYLYQQQLEEASNPAIGPLSSRNALTKDCRDKMVQWCYKVIDFCSFHRETVAIAMSILDRFLCSQDGKIILKNRNQYQLAAMTSLYTAVKLHEPEVMSAQLVATLSRGVHTAQEVEQMELRILNGIAWHVNPPTALSFVREFMKLLPSTLLVDPSIKATVFEVTKFQAELAVGDATLISTPASTIAYASLMNALGSVCLDRNAVGYVSSILSQAGHINLFAPTLAHVQARLCLSITQQSQTATIKTAISQAKAACMDHTNSGTLAKRRSSYQASPCTVTRMEL